MNRRYWCPVCRSMQDMTGGTIGDLVDCHGCGAVFYELTLKRKKREENQYMEMKPKRTSPR